MKKTFVVSLGIISVLFCGCQSQTTTAPDAYKPAGLYIHPGIGQRQVEKVMISPFSDRSQENVPSKDLTFRFVKILSSEGPFSKVLVADTAHQGKSMWDWCKLEDLDADAVLLGMVTEYQQNESETAAEGHFGYVLRLVDHQSCEILWSILQSTKIPGEQNFDQGVEESYRESARLIQTFHQK